MGLSYLRPERDIQRACLDYLAMKHILCWRANTGAFRGTYKGHDRFVRFGVKGQPDIFAVLAPHGRLVGIEVKRPGGTLSPHQAAFLDALARAGGIGLCVSSAAELEEKLQRYLEPPDGNRLA